MFSFIDCNFIENNVNAKNNIGEYIDTNICGISSLKWKITIIFGIILLIMALYVVYKWRCNRKHNGLLIYHNFRSSVALLLLVINSFEVVCALLPQTTIIQHFVERVSTIKDDNISNNNNNKIIYITVGIRGLWNSLAGITFTLILIIFYRIVELKKRIEFLYVSSTFEFLIALLYIYEFSEMFFEHTFELAPTIQITTAICLITLVCIDIYSVCKNQFDCDNLNENKKIGYKHSIVTFYSKICFWWLNPLLWLGYKRPLELNDLNEMRTEDSAREHYDQFILIYQTCKKQNKDQPPSLWYCYIKFAWRMFTIGGLLKLVGDLFALISPLAIKYIVQFIEMLYASSTPKNYTMVINNSSELNLNGIDATYNYQIVCANWLDLLENGWAISWVVLVSSIAQGAFSQASTHVLNMTGIRMKTSLQGLIYRKTLLLSSNFASNTAANNSKSNPNEQWANDEVANDVGSITNLMTEDTLNIMSFFWIAHYVWAIPLKISIVMYLLYLSLGISAVIGSLICILIVTPLQFIIGKAMSSNAELIAKHSDERLKRLHDIFVGIKLIKLNAWDDCFIRNVQQVRKEELKSLNKDSIYWSFMTLLTHLSTVVITFVTFSLLIWLEDNVYNSSVFNAGKIFSSLALFQQLTVPLLIFPITVPIIISALTSTKRLEFFLAKQEIQKHFEGIRNMARILSKSDASLDMYEIKQPDIGVKLQNNASAKNKLKVIIPSPLAAVAPLAPLAISEPHSPLLTPEPMPLSTIPMNFQMNPNELQQTNDNTKQKRSSLHRKDILRNTSYVLMRPTNKKAAIRSMNTSTLPMQTQLQSPSQAHTQRESLHRDSLLSKIPADIAVRIKNGVFEWYTKVPNNRIFIKEIAIQKGQLTIIVGKNGSGKTSLLSALLLEMPLISGDLIWNKTSTIAFVGQDTWLLNSSIRDNILFGESLRPKRYDLVLEACALKPDIEIMPEGDLTIIGERGVNLSGGQRQRVSIARALYSSANVIILDDPFSSLDNEVISHIFEHCIKEMLLKANRTVVMVTQQLHFIQKADYIIVMKDGAVDACGCWNHIEEEHPYIYNKLNSLIAKLKSDENQNGCNGFGRTARERWKLFKNISKFGLHRNSSQSTTTLEGLITDKNSYVSTIEEDNKLQLKRNRSSIYGSRHLFYDVPLPIDECQMDGVVLRRPRSGGTGHQRTISGQSSIWSGISNDSSDLCMSHCSSNISYNDISNASDDIDGKRGKQGRVKSWDPQTSNRIQNTQHKGIVRNNSTPVGRCSDAAVVADLVTSNMKCGSGYQQFLRRMSMRRSNKPANRIHGNSSATNSILSISEETVQESMPTDCRENSDIVDIKVDVQIDDRLGNNSQTNIEIDTGIDAVIDIGAVDVPQTVNAFGASLDEMKILNLEHHQHQQEEPQQQQQRVEESTLVAEQIRNVPQQLPPLLQQNTDIERQYGKISKKIYTLYLEACGYTIVMLFFFTALTWQALRVCTDIWLQYWSDNVQSNYNYEQNGVNTRIQRSTLCESVDQQKQQEDVLHHFHIYMIMSFLCVIMAMICTPCGQLAGCKARAHLHDTLLEAIMRKSLHFFQTTPVGRILIRFGNDMAIIDKKVAATSQRLLQFTLLCLCAVIINVAITPWFIVISLPITIFYYAIQKFYRRSSRELQRIENFTNSPIISHLSETIQGVSTIRAYNQEKRFTEILFHHLEANNIAFTILNTSNRWLGISLDWLGGTIVFIAIITALLIATLNYKYYVGNIESGILNNVVLTSSSTSIPTTATAKPSPSPSLVGLAINYTLLIPIYLNWVVKLLADMEMYIGSVERIAYYTDDIANTKTTAKTSSLKENQYLEIFSDKELKNSKEQTNIYQSVPISWPQIGDIRFENVSLRYENATMDVITELSLHIHAGQRIGICGRTGSGKSSIALSLFGVLRTTAGHIFIDDVDITKVNPSEIRTRLSIIPQDVHLFNASLRENLDPTGYFSDLELRKSLELAQLKDFVSEHMSNGLDTQIVDSGFSINAGHKQLLCLARAILRGSVCLVLDEATSSLDCTMERTLLSAAHNVFKGRTIITIAHRLSTILDYDRVIVLENGKIVEDGKPSEMQHKLDSTFASMLQYGNGNQCSSSNK